MIRISREWWLDESEIEERFIRASGPGGQNVNKVSTAVQLRYDAARSTAIPARVRARLLKLAGHRATADGVIVITADTHRSQRLNREEARARLIELLQSASRIPRARIATRPTAAARERRIEQKKQRGQLKRARSRGGNEY